MIDDQREELAAWMAWCFLALVTAEEDHGFHWVFWRYPDHRTRLTIAHASGEIEIRP